MTIRFDITEIPEIKRWFNRTLSRGVKRGMISAAIRTVQHIQTVEIPKAVPQPVDRGIYRAGWRWEGNLYTDEGEVSIVNSVPHAILIEEGVRAEKVKPGRKMLSALAEWVKRKGGGPGKKPAPKESAPKGERPGKPAGESASDFTAFPEIKKLVRDLARLIKKLKMGGTKKEGGQTVAKAPTDAEALSAAWAIAKAMQKKGIFRGGLHIGAKARAKMLEKFIPEEVKREIEREFGG